MTQNIPNIQREITLALGQYMEANETIAVGVSGGGDSMALLLALHQYNTESELNLNIIALTVDHRLRDDAAVEANQVAKWCANLGVPHQILEWQFETKPESAIQEKARDARYELMGEYCQSYDIKKLFLAHNLEDNAETFLMRLKRGAGLRGLSAIAKVSQRKMQDGFSFAVIRPLLATKRAELRSYLEHFDQKWFDDVSNANAAFERVRVRQFLTDRAWFENEKLANSARRLSQANDAVEYYVNQYWKNNIYFIDLGIVKLDLKQFEAQPVEIQLRLLARLVWSVGGQNNPPRWQKIENLQSQLAGATSKLQICLGNCIIVLKKNNLWFGYEGREVTKTDNHQLQANQFMIWQERLSIENQTGQIINISNLKTNARYKEKLLIQAHQLNDCPHVILKTMPIIFSANGDLLHPNSMNNTAINIKLLVQT